MALFLFVAGILDMVKNNELIFSMLYSFKKNDFFTSLCVDF